MEYQFEKARPVWGKTCNGTWNQFNGFYTQLRDCGDDCALLRVAARSVYRLYVNGTFVCHGPARCAKGYARVDEVRIRLLPETDIAIETASYDTPNKYCNDNTLEPGMLTAEIISEDGRILAATGYDFSVTELSFRRGMTETMSHSRGILEWQELDASLLEWRRGKANFKEPVLVKEAMTFLRRRSPYPDYHEIGIHRFSGICDLVKSGKSEPGFISRLSREVNPDWYRLLSDNDQFLAKARSYTDAPFSGSLEMLGQGEVSVCPDTDTWALTYELDRSEIGFIEFRIRMEEQCTILLLNSDHLDVYGNLRINTYMTRYDLGPGEYSLMTWEPKLVRYVRFMFRTTGKVTLSGVRLIDYSTPERERTFFSCSDGDLNRIYEAAKRTLRLSTLDIFMDCPQRERGGWLCDSYFSARAMQYLFGDSSVEKDFLENFLLTDPSILWKGFFPEVYPGSKKDESDPGFINWSFWLIAELYDYVTRTGDVEFANRHRKRVESFMEGMLSLRGASGLLETDRSLFTDWSIANRECCIGPINIPNNCLTVKILMQMAELYNVKMWKTTAEEMRRVILTLSSEHGVFGGNGDAAEWVALDSGRKELRRRDIATEGGAALELWSGFHLSDDNYRKLFMLTMGPCPCFRSNPNIGKANQFIGLMIRFDVLAMLGEKETLIRELRNVYLEELRLGSGTFFENINAFSGCHGFNGMAGAYLMSEILGFKKIDDGNKEITISPFPGNLRWARGAVWTSDGPAFLSFSSDEILHHLDVRITVPKGWKVTWKPDFYVKGWRLTLNGEII